SSTRDAATLGRELILQYYEAQLASLYGRLSASDYQVEISPQIGELINRYREAFPELEVNQMRFPEPELYRRLLAYIHHRIRLSREEPTSSAGYAGPENLIDDLQVIRKSLVAHNAIRSAELLLDPLLRTIRVFGFHLHSIDIRQH